MREILFRGKRCDNGEWVEGFLLKECNYVTCSWNLAIEFKTDRFGKFAYDVAEIIPETVGQFTGLTANGKKIFEGDILKDEWGKIYKVIFTTKSCGFMVECTVAPNEYETGRYRIGDAWCNTIKVIGNIHDNPELLGGTEDGK